MPVLVNIRLGLHIISFFIIFLISISLALAAAAEFHLILCWNFCYFSALLGNWCFYYNVQLRLLLPHPPLDLHELMQLHRFLYTHMYCILRHVVFKYCEDMLGLIQKNVGTTWRFSGSVTIKIPIGIALCTGIEIERKRISGEVGIIKDIVSKHLPLLNGL